MALPNQNSFQNGALPAALLSDMDGILLDTEQVSKRTFDDLVRDYGLTNGGDIFPRLIGRNKAAHLDIFASMLPSGVDPHTFNADWMQRYLTVLDDNVPVKKGAVDFLTCCLSHGMPMAVVTSSETAKAEDFLTRAGLRGFFDAVIGGDQVEKGKPHPDIYRHAAASLSHPITDCLALEDSHNGVLSAYHAGAKVIQIPDLVPQDDNLAALNIPSLPSLSDVPGYLGWPMS